MTNYKDTPKRFKPPLEREIFEIPICKKCNKPITQRNTFGQLKHKSCRDKWFYIKNKRLSEYKKIVREIYKKNKDKRKLLTAHCRSFRPSYCSVAKYLGKCTDVNLFIYDMEFCLEQCRDKHLR